MCVQGVWGFVGIGGRKGAYLLSLSFGEGRRRRRGIVGRKGVVGGFARMAESWLERGKGERRARGILNYL